MIKSSYATAGFVDRDLEAALDAIAAVGFKRAEILGQDPHADTPLTGRELTEFTRRLHARGLEVSVHAPLNVNVLGAPQEQWRRDKVEVLGAYLQFAGEIGAREMVVHPVPNPCFVTNPNDPELPKKMRNATRRSLDELVPVCESAGVRILLENLPYKCDYPFLGMKQLKVLVESYCPEVVGLLVDTGHAAVMGLDPADEVRLAGDRLGGVHLHDSDGVEDRHWLPGKGIINWDEVCRSLTQVDFQGPWIFELSGKDDTNTPEELCQQALIIANQWQNPS